MIKYLELKLVTAQHGSEISEAVQRVVDSGWYLQGAENKAFCEEFASFIGTTHCIGCGNGLDALTLILRAYKEMGVMQDGDEVIVPANTYIATILAITENNLKPVLVEPRIDTFQIDDTRIEEAITPRTRAIMIVHLYGKCAYTDHIGDICRTCDSSRTTRRLTDANTATDAQVRLAMRLLTVSIQARTSAHWATAELLRPTTPNLPRRLRHSPTMVRAASTFSTTRAETADSTKCRLPCCA